jgi:hypothetical protein
VLNTGELDGMAYRGGGQNIAIITKDDKRVLQKDAKEPPVAFS